MKKLLLSSVLATSIFAGLCTPVFASTNATSVSDDAIVSVCELSDGVTKASWRQGTLTSKNPLGQKPWAYAKTEKCTFTGKHSLQDTSSSGWQTATTSKTY